MTLFPKFQKLSLLDRGELVSFTENFLPYSDFNFTSLWSYDTEDDLHISMLNGNLVVRFRNYLTLEPFYSFLGKNDVDDTVKKLLDLSSSEGLRPVLSLIPEEVILNSKHIKSRYLVLEDTDNFDYILSIESLCRLEGSEYSHYRKQLNRYNRSFPNTMVRKLDLNDAGDKKRILDLFSLWRVLRNKQISDTETELRAITRVMEDENNLNVFVLGAFYGEELIAFFIVDLDHSTYAQSHFMKSNPEYQGVAYALRHHLVQELRKRGFVFLNIEQDLGIPGLRKSKMKYRPVRFLKKYTIMEKPISLKI